MILLTLASNGVIMCSIKWFYLGGFVMKSIRLKYFLCSLASLALQVVSIVLAILSLDNNAFLFVVSVVLLIISVVSDHFISSFFRVFVSDSSRFCTDENKKTLKGG